MIGDFTDAATCMQLIDSCGGGCDVVLCDAAPNSSGQQWCATTCSPFHVSPCLIHFFCHRADHLRSVELCASALEVACRLLSFGNGSSAATGSGRKVATAGTFVTKLWSGGEQQQLIADMRSR
jgi:23S rRNA U2552 (ribose-2'-O)-methylase RlmE/FtsJ